MTAKTTETSKAWREYNKAKAKFNKQRHKINAKEARLMKAAQVNAGEALLKIEELERAAIDRISKKYNIH